MLGFLIVAAGSIPIFLIALPLIPWRVARIKLCNFYGHVVGRAVMWCAGASPRVNHPERIDAARPAIYIANHTSTLDAFVSIWLCPYGGCGVLKKEITLIPFFGQLLLLSGHLILNRQNKAGAVAALKDVARLVKAKGLSIWVMPEGTRTADGRLGRFKTGFVHLAIATGLPVVPVVLHSAHKIWPLKELAIYPGTLDIDVLPPIDTSSWREETSKAHAAEVQAVMARAVRPEQQPLPEAAASA